MIIIIFGMVILTAILFVLGVYIGLVHSLWANWRRTRRENKALNEAIERERLADQQTERMKKVNLGL